MKTLIAMAFLLTLAACSTEPEPESLSKPPDDAAVWNLNEGIQQGTNDLIHQPVWQQP